MSSPSGSELSPKPKWWRRSGFRSGSITPVSRTPSTEPPKSSGERNSFSFTRRPKSIKSSSDLCQKCSLIGFDQFAASESYKSNITTDTSTILLPLEDIIKNQRDQGCMFCNFLFDAIALPAHDPFTHPAIKDHMPPDLLGKTFETWAKGLKWHDQLVNSAHPFGKSRNRIKLEIDPDDPGAKIQEIRRRDVEAAEQAGLIASAATTGAAVQAATQEEDENKRTMFVAAGSAGSLLTSAFATMERKLPSVVTVKMHNRTDADAGLLSISLLGYGNKNQAPLSVLTSFNLRVASDYQEIGTSLHYGRIIGEDIKVEEDCRTWLTHCQQRHRHLCETPDWSKHLPPPSGEHFRLIEIDDEGNFRVIRVIDELQGAVPEYAALSYVWGDAGVKAVNLHPNNIPQLNKQVQSEWVAKTVADAVQVTKRLGIRYLWVDSLCVFQKPQSGDDEPAARQSQLDQMGSIYGHACVAIVAAGGEDAGAGLAGISHPRRLQQIAQEVRPGVNVMLPVQYGDSYGKWDTRAWTLQEKLLSKRLLVFDGEHVSFHCRQGVLREDMPAVHACNGPPQMPHLNMPENPGAVIVKTAWDGSPVLLRSPFFDEYAKLMEQYTSRDRSNSSDILKAVLGLLGVLENMRRAERRSLLKTLSGIEKDTEQDHTLHGLPEEFLDLALLWQPPAAQRTHLTKRTSDILPSWSWAGWEVGREVSQGQDATRVYVAHQGVRFEEPFWVSTHEDMSLKKFVATGTKAEERFRPLIMWYKWVEDPRPLSPPTSTPRPDTNTPSPKPKPTHLRKPVQPTGKLVPVNGNGMGIVSGSLELEERWGEEVNHRFGKLPGESTPPRVQPGTPLDGRHLVCETQVGTFKLRQKDKTPRKEPLWKRTDGDVAIAKELQILEAEVLDDSGRVVGYVIPTDQRKIVGTEPYSFILLSESQYWGNETRVDLGGFPMYNAMAVAWDTRQEFATRIGLGKIYKSAWDEGNPDKRCVILK